MLRSPSFYIFLVLAHLAQTTWANDQRRPEQWDRTSAMLAVRAVDIDLAVREIGNLATLNDAESTLKNLHSIANRSDWPLPVREAVIYRFTQSLATMPRAAVAAGVVSHLKNFQAHTLVPHEDHGGASIPLFNIRAAAAGVENGWLRNQSSLEAESLLITKPATLVDHYRKSGMHNVRSGYMDSLRYADLMALTVVQNAALEQLAQAPELTAVVGLTASITGDNDAMLKLLIDGRGAGLATALQRFSEQLQAVEISDLLAEAIEHAPTTNAALAIAQWWPRLRHDKATRELLLDYLADPELGSAAALALAQSPDLQTIKSLRNIAEGNSVAAKRAQMALDTDRAQLTTEVRL